MSNLMIRYKYLTAGPDLSRAYFGVYKNKLHKLFNMKCYPTHVLVLLFRQHCIYKFDIYSGTSKLRGAACFQYTHYISRRDTMTYLETFKSLKCESRLVNDMIN